MSHYYIRGTAPYEAKEAIIGKCGRVDATKTITNRGADTARLAFGMNREGKPGVDGSLVDEFLIEAAFYANAGAYAEAHPELPRELKRRIDPNYRGYLCIFKTDTSLPIHTANLRYGSAWETTSELPEGIERKLVGITPAPPMEDASTLGEYKQGEYSLLKPSVKEFEELHQRTQKKN
ncbi:MAG: hypothetical protein ACMXYE_05030 [Candidatus Woesearchaeota archaeon]